MTGVKVVFLDRATVAAAEPVRPACADEWVVHDLTAPHETARRIADATVVFTNKVELRGAALASAARLKLVVVAATGYDIVDTAACRRRAVAVANSPGYSSSSVPEHALALMLAVARSIVPLCADARDGTWPAAPTFCLHTRPITELRGRTVGLVGSGSLGRSTGRLCEALGMRTLYLRREGARKAGDGVERADLDELLARADVLSLHCPLTEANRGMIGPEALKKMNSSAILINTARGGLVDSPALVSALESGEIAGAGIDVLEPEPPPADHPLLVCDHPGLVVTPHVAWASIEVQRRLVRLIAETADAFYDGKPQHLVA